MVGPPDLGIIPMTRRSIVAGAHPDGLVERVTTPVHLPTVMALSCPSVQVRSVGRAWDSSHRVQARAYPVADSRLLRLRDRLGGRGPVGRR
ncbi:hypothetical protein ACFU8I_01770 [Streptomyces sp. NPDC057540]|uniref:hypothetical protein n=1 Tax=Streptomyces sp. NPDC057540 TaxID=3346160 RepID=UPI0036BA746B